MKLKENLVLKEVCGEFILISIGTDNVDFSQIINFNETSAYIWNTIKDKEFTVKDMTDAVVSKYDISEEEALIDCQNLLQQWKELNFLD